MRIPGFSTHILSISLQVEESFVKLSFLAPVMLWLASSLAASGGHAGERGVSAEQALSKLMIGNRRYSTNHMSHPHQSREHRMVVSKAQHPFATVLSCADSRVTPEIVFDEGLGDLFVVRVAGNVIDDMIVGSLEYAAEHLGVPLIVVLGHTRCGAVTAAASGGQERNHVDALLRAIQPAVAQASKEPGDRVANAIRDNVQLVVRQLRQSRPVLAELQMKGRLKVVGAIYNLETGIVEFLK
jgi:carbonic anhydrase